MGGIFSYHSHNADQQTQIKATPFGRLPQLFLQNLTAHYIEVAGGDGHTALDNLHGFIQEFGHGSVFFVDDLVSSIAQTAYNIK